MWDKGLVVCIPDWSKAGCFKKNHALEVHKNVFLWSLDLCSLFMPDLYLYFTSPQAIYEHIILNYFILKIYYK